MEGPLLDKSLEFASRVVLFYEEFSKSKKTQRLPNSFFVPQHLLEQT